MRNFLIILLLSQLFFLNGCATFTKQEGLPSMAQIDRWVDNDQYGLALTSLEHISPTEKLFAAYVKKRKTVKVLAIAYEKAVIRETKKDLKKSKWSEAILTLNTARNNYPNSSLIHDRYNMVLKQQQKRIHKFDAKALLAHAKLLSNKLPISQKDADNSPINIVAQWDLQSLKNELTDMHNRLMAMTEQLLDDNEIRLAEKCLNQAKTLAHGKQELASIKSLQTKVTHKKRILKKALAKRTAERKQRTKVSQKKKHSRKVSQLITKVNHSLKNNELVNAEKLLMTLARLAPDSSEFLQLRLKHRHKVDKLVYKMTEQGNSLYRQEKIAEAKHIWEIALKLDTKNKTLQVQIRRANRVLQKLEELRTRRRAAVRQ
ncbi:MAG: hypothetical protein KAT25_02665 [Sulfuriflexus sp.]|nr:hypothetical protein [Sulfuriflexus sp.]